MRASAIALLFFVFLSVFLCPDAGAQADKNATRAVKGPEDRISITVPADWKSMEIAGSMIIRVVAPGAYGGHDFRVEREEGQEDVDKQRDRYLDYDSANAPSGTVQKKTKPYYGYRINDADKNRILIRAFITDGSDGLVLTCTSRFQYYDKLWAAKIEEVIASLDISGATTGRPELEGDLRRLFDRKARASFVAPGIWKPLTPQFDDELLFVCLKGSKTGPRFTLKEWPGKGNTGLLLLKVGGQWKRSYANVTIKRLSGDRPRMIVKNRVPGSVDYVQAFASEGNGFTFTLTVREGSFEKFRTVADKLAESLVFTGGPFEAPAAPHEDVRELYRKLIAVNASAELSGAVDRVLKVLPGFDKNWSRIGMPVSRNAPPLEVMIVSAKSFTEQSHFFGDPPVAYDRSRRVVVVTPPPKDSRSRMEMWRGRLYAALTENILHRDVQASVPPWFRAGLMTCMDAAGRSGKGADQPHPAFVDRLVVLVDTDAHKSLPDVLKMTEADVLLADKPEMRILAWGYTHLMIFGKGSLGGLYKRWKKALSKAYEKAPEFDLKKYVKSKEDLKKHVFKHWGR